MPKKQALETLDLYPQGRNGQDKQEKGSQNEDSSVGTELPPKLDSFVLPLKHVHILRGSSFCFLVPAASQNNSCPGRIFIS